MLSGRGSVAKFNYAHKYVPVDCKNSVPLRTEAGSKVVSLIIVSTFLHTHQIDLKVFYYIQAHETAALWCNIKIAAYCNFYN